MNELVSLLPAFNKALLLAVIAGVLSGAYYGFLRYFAEYLSKGESFEAAKLTKTLGLGVVVGFIGGYAGITFESAEEMFANSGLYFLVILVLDKFVVPIGVGVITKIVNFVQDHLPKAPPTPVATMPGG